MGQGVRVDIVDIDRYHRLVSLIYLGNRNISQEMVGEGYAWAYEKYSERPYASLFMYVEREAYDKKRGLWKQANPQPPWEWRAEKRSRNKGSEWFSIL